MCNLNILDSPKHLVPGLGLDFSKNNGEKMYGVRHTTYRVVPRVSIYDLGPNSFFIHLIIDKG